MAIQRELLSRRNFLIAAGVIVCESVLNACAPRLARIATATSTLTPYPTETTTPTDTATATQTSLPKEPTPEVWNLSLADRIKLMSSPDFLREVMAFQFDDKEYVGMHREGRGIFKNNTCFGATIATIWDMLLRFTGQDGDKTIADVYQKIDGETFQDDVNKDKQFKYVSWDDQVDFYGFPSALQRIMPQLISKTEFLTPDLGGNHVARVFPKSNWPPAMEKAQTICENGGFLIIECYKHGDRHFVLATDVKADGTQPQL